MFEYEYSQESDVAAEAGWKLYINTATWPIWDTGTEKVELSGPFAAETLGPQIGPGITADIPQSIAALVDLAKSRQA